MIHNRWVCRCKLGIDLASKVFFLMWKHICNHFNTGPGILFEIGSPCLENEAWRWQRSLRPVYESNSGTWAARSLNDTVKNRCSVQFNAVFCPFTTAVSSEAFAGTHRCQGKLSQGRWVMADRKSRERAQESQHFTWPTETSNWFCTSQTDPLTTDLLDTVCLRAVGSQPVLAVGFKSMYLLLKLFSQIFQWGDGYCSVQCNSVPMLTTFKPKPEQPWLTPADLTQGQVKLLSTTRKKRIRSNLKQASLSGKQLAASLIAWKNIFSAQLHFSDAFYVAAHVTPREDEWAQMWSEHLTSSVHPPPRVFSSLMLRQSLISQADKRMEWAFPRWWQMLIKFKCWSYCLDYNLLRAESDLAFVFACTPWVQRGTEVPVCHRCEVSSCYAGAEARSLNTDLSFLHAGEGCCGLWCPGPLLLYGGWPRRAQHIRPLPWTAHQTEHSAPLRPRQQDVQADHRGRLPRVHP